LNAATNGTGSDRADIFPLLLRKEFEFVNVVSAAIVMEQVHMHPVPCEVTAQKIGVFLHPPQYIGPYTICNKGDAHAGSGMIYFRMYITSFTALITRAALGRLASMSVGAYGRGVSAVVMRMIGASR
jgi:hypothetical protein